MERKQRIKIHRTWAIQQDVWSWIFGAPILHSETPSNTISVPNIRSYSYAVKSVLYTRRRRPMIQNTAASSRRRWLRNGIRYHMMGDMRQVWVRWRSILCGPHDQPQHDHQQWWHCQHILYTKLDLPEGESSFLVLGQQHIKFYKSQVGVSLYRGMTLPILLTM